MSFQGHPRLVSALSKLYSPLIGQKLDPNTNVSVSVGAYGALFCAVQGLINQGDEAVIIEPYFDCYEPMVKVAGAIPYYCPLRPVSTWEFWKNLQNSYPNPEHYERFNKDNLFQTKTEGVTSSGDWKLDPKELESKFSEKTKAVFINNPNNPLGKV